MGLIILSVPFSIFRVIFSTKGRGKFLVSNQYNINGADPKVLKFNKVYMITHRRSGLLISKFAL